MFSSIDAGKLRSGAVLCGNDRAVLAASCSIFVGSNDKSQDIYEMSRAIYVNLSMLSVAGSISVADDVKRNSNEFMHGSMADRADRAFDKCLSNDLNFNAKYFKGEAK